MLVSATTVLTRLITARWTSFQLTDESRRSGETRAGFPRRAALNLVGGCYNVMLAFMALPAAVRFMADHEAASGVMIVPDSDVAETRLEDVAQDVGHLYMAYIVHQCVCCLLRWEKTSVDTVVHHVIFLALSGLLTHYHFMPELATVLISMEVSTPPLLAMLLFRRVRGHARLVGVLSVAFGILFFLARILLFTAGLLRSLSLWVTRPAVYMNDEAGYPPTWTFMCVHVCCLAGLALQYVWGVGLLRKAVGGTRSIHERA
jgi:hypothetical protein